MSQIRTLRGLSQAIRARRKALGWSQDTLAQKAGVSRWWISEFETDHPRAEVVLVLKVLDALGLALEVPVLEDRVSDALHRDRAPQRENVDLDRHLEEYGRQA